VKASLDIGGSSIKRRLFALTKNSYRGKGDNLSGRVVNHCSFDFNRLSLNKSMQQARKINIARNFLLDICMKVDGKNECKTININCDM
jgi:hypothetical protein